MKISLIVAMDQNGVIGKDNQLPWHLPNDLKHVKEITTGHAIVLGRKNYESIGKPLPNRTNIILTRDKNYSAEGCVVLHSVEEVLNYCKDKDEIFIFGGAEIYALFMPYVEKMYITKIYHEFDGDVYFPEINWQEWGIKIKSKGIRDEKKPYFYEYLIYERIKKN